MAQVDNRDGLVGATGIKQPVKLATTAEIDLEGLDAIDGVTPATGDRILVKDQSDATENGIYVADTSAWQRSTDCDGRFDLVPGTIVLVTSGSTNQGFWEAGGTAPLIPGTSSISWTHSLVNDAANIEFLQSGTGAVPRTVQGKLRDVVSVKDFGALGDGATDDAVAIQAAIDAVGSGGMVWFPAGTYMIGSSINLKTQRHLRGSMTGSVIKALGTWNPTVPTITASTYSPVLDYAPLMYNKDAIDWWSIEGIDFHGNDQECYGLYLSENYHGSIKNSLVQNTNRRPYTNIRGQSVSHENFTCYDCNDGVVSYDNTGLTFLSCGWERLACTWAYDQRQPNGHAKGGVVIENGWFESASGATITEGFLRMSGRRNRVSGHFAFHDAATVEYALYLNDNTTGRTVDGISMGASPCIRGQFEVNNASGAMLLAAATNSGGNIVTGTYTVANVTDSGTGNSFNLNGGLATQVQHVTGRFQVRAISLTAANFALDADWNGGTPQVRMIGSAGNLFDADSGVFRMTGATGLRFVATAGFLQWSGSSYQFAGSSGATGYEKPLYLGSFALWVDSTGDLRIKSGAPTSDTDGTVVGTQS